jgi:hypothetical protein
MAGEARTAGDQSVNQGAGILVFDPTACCILGNYMHDCHVRDPDGINSPRMIPRERNSKGSFWLCRELTESSPQEIARRPEAETI